MFRNWKRFPCYCFMKFAEIRDNSCCAIDFFLTIIKVGAANMALLNFFNTPVLINLLTSFLRVGS